MPTVRGEMGRDGEIWDGVRTASRTPGLKVSRRVYGTTTDAPSVPSARVRRSLRVTLTELCMHLRHRGPGVLGVRAKR